jgi:hypothetical protein
MRSNNNAKAADAGRKQSPVDGVSRCVSDAVAPAFTPTLHCVPSALGAWPQTSRLQTCTVKETSFTNIGFADDQVHRKLGAQPQAQVPNEAQWLHCKMGPAPNQETLAV